MTHPAASALDAQSIRIEKRINMTMMLIAIALVPISATQPSCMSLYWLTSATLALIQNIAFAVPRTRRILGKF